MSTFKLNTPVAFIIFRRPDTTARVFEAIRQAKPPKLLVVADGPRVDRPDEAEKCAAARDIINRVDWDCEIIKNYSTGNLGCAKRVSSGLNWIFEQVEEAIILEDDCVPHYTFFQYCEELLEQYRDDNRIGSITGQNVQFGRERTDSSYYFSRYSHCWGWATWRRAWHCYDLNMSLWPEIKSQEALRGIFTEPHVHKCWTKIFQEVYDDPLGITWDYQWTFTCLVQGFLSITSNANLVSNIGFGSDSTHFTVDEPSSYDTLPTEAMEFPLRHPRFLIPNRAADTFTQNTLYDYYTWSGRFGRKVKKIRSLLLSTI